MAQSALVWTQAVEVQDHTAARSAMETALGREIPTAKIWRPKNMTVNSVVCLDS